MGAKAKDVEKLRRFPRREYKRKIGILFAGVYIVVDSIEISEGGISFFSDQVFSKERECILSFQIPAGDFLSIRGIVKRMTKENSGMIIGISFGQMAFSHKRQIRNYVADRDRINHN